MPSALPASRLPILSRLPECDWWREAIFPHPSDAYPIDRRKRNPFGEAIEKRRTLSTEFKPKEKASLLFFGCVASYQDINVIPSVLKIMDKAKIDYTALGMRSIAAGISLTWLGMKSNLRDVLKTI